MDGRGRLAEGAEAQAGLALDNLEAILTAAGLDMDSVLKVTVYLADIGDFADVNSVYEDRFAEPYPARAAVEVSALPGGALVEIEAVAAEDG
jgi:2-iminobutanoate/2-iminopropanoate deaminase